MNDTNGFQRFLDVVRMPVFILVIVAALVIGYINQSAFEQFLGMTNTPAPSTTQPTVALTQSTSTVATQLAAQIILDNPSAFPKSVMMGEIVPFSFTIQNTGTGVATFQYKVYAQWGSGEQDVIDENVVTLDAGQRKSIPEDLKFEQASDQAEILVTLPTVNQQVKFVLPAGQ